MINSQLYLLENVDLDPDFNFTIDFENIDKQNEYFDSKKTLVLLPNEDYSYIRVDETIKIEKNIDELDNINYLYFINNEKRYYAFITRKQYVSEDVTRIYFKIDVFQTFMFDYEIQESFVDREHQDRFDKAGNPIFNLQPENLNMGEDYETTKSTTFRPAVEDSCFYIILAKEPIANISIYNSNEFKTDEQGTPSIYPLEKEYDFDNSLTSPYYIYLVSDKLIYLKLKRGDTTYIAPYDLMDFQTSKAQKIIEDPRVVAIFATKYLPENISFEKHTSNSYYWDMVVDTDNNPTINGLASRYKSPDGVDGPALFRLTQLRGQAWSNFEITEQIEKPISKDEKYDEKYEIKLLTSPFHFLRMNINGEFHNFKRENFDKDIKFALIQSVGENGDVYIIPRNYNKKELGFFNMFQAKKSNDITLKTDAWQNYILNNKASINGGLVVSGIQTAGSMLLGAMTGGLGLAMAGTQALSFGGQVANEMIKRQDLKNQPDDIRPSKNDTIVSQILFNLCITVDEIDLKPQYKTRIAKYFHHYGYKCNDFKKPNLKSRYYFNYIKTIGVNLKTNINADYKTELADIFNNGITIWHYRDAGTFKGVNNFDYENIEISLMEG